METVRVSAKGQVVIPAPIRKKCGVRPGTMLRIFEYDNLICLVPPSENAVESAMGCFPKKPSLSKELLKNRL